MVLVIIMHVQLAKTAGMSIFVMYRNTKHLCKYYCKAWHASVRGVKVKNGNGHDGMREDANPCTCGRFMQEVDDAKKIRGLIRLDCLSDGLERSKGQGCSQSEHAGHRQGHSLRCEEGASSATATTGAAAAAAAAAKVARAVQVVAAAI